MATNHLPYHNNFEISLKSYTLRTEHFKENVCVFLSYWICLWFCHQLYISILRWVSASTLSRENSHIQPFWLKQWLLLPLQRHMPASFFFVVSGCKCPHHLPRRLNPIALVFHTESNRQGFWWPCLLDAGFTATLIQRVFPIRCMWWSCHDTLLKGKDWWK